MCSQIRGTRQIESKAGSISNFKLNNQLQLNQTTQPNTHKFGFHPQPLVNAFTLRDENPYVP